MQFCRACAIMLCYSLAMKRSDLRQCNFQKRQRLSAASTELQNAPPTVLFNFRLEPHREQSLSITLNSALKSHLLISIASGGIYRATTCNVFACTGAAIVSSFN